MEKNSGFTLLKRVLSSSVGLALFGIIIVIASESASAQVRQEWVARYSGSGNFLDKAYAVALDAAGNVYVTGNSVGSGSCYDYATIKYNASGKELWVARYNGPGNAYDEATAIAVDAAGNVYVTGQSTGSDSEKAYATIKYDANGNELWASRGGGSSATALAVDAAGNVYVTGTGIVGFELTDVDIIRFSGYVTMKYDARGKEMWMARWGYDWGTNEFADFFATALAVDTSGNVYVTGNAITIKYDADGNVLWVARYQPGNFFAITVDAAGNVYVTGGAYQDYATVKYDASGNELWVARYNGPGNSDDKAKSIAVDTSGSIFVTGYSAGSGTGKDYTTIKYDASGKELWVARYNGTGNMDDVATAFGVDSSGDVYVTGSSIGSDSYQDYATIKYDANGNQLWIARYNGPGNGQDYANALMVDPAGNTYVTGGSDSSGDNTSSDYATIKYDASGNDLWVARYIGPDDAIMVDNGSDAAAALSLDISGNVYVTGYSTGSRTGRNYATIKYDASGNELWAANYNGPGNGEDYANAIAVDAAGNVYVTGSSIGSGTGSDYAAIKYDANGNQLWIARYNGPGNGEDYANAIAVDAVGNVYVTGGSEAYYVTIKYDASGNELWVARYIGKANALAVDAAGNVYVTGSSNSDYATIKYDANGKVLWVTRYSFASTGSEEAKAIMLDAVGNVYVTGYSYRSGLGNYPISDYATIKYDASGNELWVARYTGKANPLELEYIRKANALAVDAAGNVYVTGSSNSDYATIKYDAGGHEIWVAGYNGLGNAEDYANAIAVDAAGNVYVTGGSVGSGSEYDFATIKLVQDSSNGGSGDSDSGCFIAALVF